ncbi:MAG: hypothetical protein Q8P32_00895 [Candidatus Komeilibacteria bacterium]|nr:hypothetical protein [Candidatus Komeilibacteria bacterium]
MSQISLSEYDQPGRPFPWSLAMLTFVLMALCGLTGFSIIVMPTLIAWFCLAGISVIACIEAKAYKHIGHNNLETAILSDRLFQVTIGISLGLCTSFFWANEICLISAALVALLTMIIQVINRWFRNV